MFLNYDLLTISTIFAISIDLLLGLLVFVNNRKSETNIIFGFLNIALSFYLMSNLFAVSFLSYNEKLFWVRMTMFAAVFLDTFFYLFIRVFPNKKLIIGKKEIFLIVFLTVSNAILCFTPFLFSGIKILSGTTVPNPVSTNPFGLAIFGITAMLFVGGGIFLLVKRYFCEENIAIRKQISTLIWGAGIMFSSFIIFNFIFTVLFNDAYYVQITPLFTTVFVGASAYAIFRLKMFNLKIIATELLVFLLWFFVLARIILSNTYEEQVLNGSLLILLLVTGIFLIKSVMKEVEQKEKLEESAVMLKESHEREMEKTRSEAKLRDEFVFVAAHELRTPITAIRGFLELVSDAEGSFPSDVQSDLDAIKMASEHLNELVNNLLEVARSDAGAMKVETKPVFIVNALKNVLSEVNSLIIEKKIILKTNNFKEEIKIVADEEKLKEVLMNLVSNAIKYNKKDGELEIGVLPDGFGKIIIEVRDTGFGIPMDQQKKIFGKFFRASSKDTQGIIGTGLGLFITKMLVEKMGGEINFSSVEGKGTTFALSFPSA